MVSIFYAYYGNALRSSFFCRQPYTEITPDALSINGKPIMNHIAAVPLDKAYRLINHGPTVLVSAHHNGINNVMAASWACALDYAPPKVTIVLDKHAKTRELIEDGGRFVIQVPTVAQIQMTYDVGQHSLGNEPDKLVRYGVELFNMPGSDLPLVAGCSAWLACKLVREPHNQNTYDLFIGEVTAAWADTRVFKDGHWQFEHAEASLRSLHYIAGGHFYAIGDALSVK